MGTLQNCGMGVQGEQRGSSLFHLLKGPQYLELSTTNCLLLRIFEELRE